MEVCIRGAENDEEGLANAFNNIAGEFTEEQQAFIAWVSEAKEEDVKQIKLYLGGIMFS